jgi:hypothetical protein
VGGVLIYVPFVIVLDPIYHQWYAGAFLAAFGLPLAVLVLVVSIVLAVGLLGTLIQEGNREWWAALCAWLLIYAAAWAVTVGISSFGPWLIVKFGAWAWAVGSGWVLTSVAGLLTGWSSRTGSARSSKRLEWVARIAPLLSVIGVLVLLALAIDLAQCNLPGTGASGTEHYFAERTKANGVTLLIVTVACLIFALVVSFRVDVNAFSLAGLYANRLVAATRGASRKKQSDGVANDPRARPPTGRVVRPQRPLLRQPQHRLRPPRPLRAGPPVDARDGRFAVRGGRQS